MESCSPCFTCVITKVLYRGLKYNELNPLLSDKFSVGWIGCVVQCLVMELLFFYQMQVRLSWIIRQISMTCKQQVIVYSL
jgi:hypothetical protein